MDLAALSWRVPADLPKTPLDSKRERGHLETTGKAIKDSHKEQREGAVP